MQSTLLLLALMASPQAVYFFQDGTQLFRAEVVSVAQQSSGGARANVLRLDPVKIPGAVVAHQQRGAEAVVVACIDGVMPTDLADECDVFRVDARGAVQWLKRKALSATLLPDGAVLEWSSALELRRDGVVVARHAFEARVSPDGSRIGTAVDPRAERFEPGEGNSPEYRTKRVI